MEAVDVDAGYSDEDMADCCVETESRTLSTGVSAGSRENADGGGRYPVSRWGRLDACLAAFDFAHVNYSRRVGQEHVPVCSPSTG